MHAPGLRHCAAVNFARNHPGKWLRSSPPIPKATIFSLWQLPAASTTAMAASTPNCRTASHTQRRRRPRGSNSSATSSMASKLACGFCPRNCITPIESVTQTTCCWQRLREVPHDDRVIGRLAQEGGDPFESFDEFHKIFVGVALADFFFRYLHAMTRGNLRHCRWLQRALKMHMQLGLGQGSDANGERGQTSGLSR